jgi:hypothetical protein
MGPQLARLAGLAEDSKDAHKLLRRYGANRKGRLKGAGNSIVPQLGALFLIEFMEAAALFRARG